MRAEPCVDGRVVQFEIPDWRPLARVVGEQLLSTFMWMYEVGTGDGGRFHAYKHIETRRYLHLDLHGAAFVYIAEDRYRRTALADVLERAFEPWWDHLGASPEDVAAAWTAIERARRSPGRGLGRLGDE